MELINKIALFTTTDPVAAENFANEKARRVGQYLRNRASRGGDKYNASINASAKYNERRNADIQKNRALQTPVVGRDVDMLTATNPLTGNLLVEDKINGYGSNIFNKGHDKNFIRMARNNARIKRNAAAEANKVKWRNGILAGTGLLTAGTIGMSMLGGHNSPEELEALHQQAQETQANDNYKLPLAIGAGTLGAAYMLGDKNDRRRMANGREYNPYS